jgi:hypothetical protein
MLGEARQSGAGKVELHHLRRCFATAEDTSTVGRAKILAKRPSRSSDALAADVRRRTFQLVPPPHVSGYYTESANFCMPLPVARCLDEFELRAGAVEACGAGDDVEMVSPLR